MRTFLKQALVRSQKKMYTSSLVIVVAAGMPAAWALSPQSYYPYALEPTLPNAAEAQRMVAAFPWILRPLREAHQQSIQRGWKSIAPPLLTVEHQAGPLTPANKK